MKRRAPLPPPPPGRGRRLAALVVAGGCIALQAGGELHLAVAALAIWLATVAIVDRHALVRLRMPRFWAVTIVFALGSGLLLGARDLELLGFRVSSVGLRAGAMMVLRGAFVFALASWATRAAAGVGLGRLAQRAGLGSLGVAVTSAFAVLPAVRDGLLERREARRRAGTRLGGAALSSLASDALTEAAALAERLAVEMAGERRARLVAVVGARGAGKTTAIRRILAALEARGLAVGGVFQPAIEGPERREGYDVEDPSTGERRPLARRGEEGRFVLDDAAFRWAAERLRIAQQDLDVVVVDEMGLAEAKGGGHLASLLALCESPGRAAVLLAAVRQGCLEPLGERLGEPALVLEAPLDEPAAAEAAAVLERLVREARSLEAGQGVDV